MQNFNKKAFTMIELVFVIVVLGILAAVAIPRLAATRTDAEISKGRSDVASIRSAIITERQSRLITGDSTYILPTTLNTGGLFGGVLTYAITAGSGAGHWSNTAADVNTSTYNYNVAGFDIPFTYTRSTGKFTCPDGNTTQEQKYCGSLTH